MLHWQKLFRPTYCALGPHHLILLPAWNWSRLSRRVDARYFPAVSIGFVTTQLQSDFPLGKAEPVSDLRLDRAVLLSQGSILFLHPFHYFSTKFNRFLPTFHLFFIKGISKVLITFFQITFCNLPPMFVPEFLDIHYFTLVTFGTISTLTSSLNS